MKSGSFEKVKEAIEAPLGFGGWCWWVEKLELLNGFLRGSSGLDSCFMFF